MKSLRFLDRRVGFSLGAASLLLGMVAPAVVPAFASADNQVTGRSIQMSSSAQNAAGVTYNTTFTPATSGSASYGGGASVTDVYVLELFCSNSPLVSAASCAAPSGMNMSSDTVDAGDTTATRVSSGANYTIVSIPIADVTSGTPLSVVLDGVNNPDGTDLTGQSGTFYGRIETYDSSTAATSAATGPAAGVVDDGGVALAVTTTIAVDAAVLESLTFCVFGDPGNTSGGGTATNASDASGYLGTTLGALTSANVTTKGPGSSCSDTAAGDNAPSVKLGEFVANNVYALNTGVISYAADWTQLSTNASSGATVYLKSGNTCVGGGLSRGDGTACDIPGETGTLAAGTAGFGVALGTPVNLNSSTTNDGTITLESAYNSSGPKYALGAATNSTYGDPFYTTSSGPATDWDVPMGLAATISNNTPAGNYKDNLSLVAVGSF